MKPSKHLIAHLVLQRERKHLARWLAHLRRMRSKGEVTYALECNVERVRGRYQAARRACGLK